MSAGKLLRAMSAGQLLRAMSASELLRAMSACGTVKRGTVEPCAIWWKSAWAKPPAARMNSAINIVPSRRTRSSKDVSTWQLDAYRFEVRSSPIRPTPSCPRVRHRTRSARRTGHPQRRGPDRPARRRRGQDRPGDRRRRARRWRAPIRLLQQLHSAPLDPELLGAAVSRVRDAGVTTAVRVSPQNVRAHPDLAGPPESTC